MDQAQYAQNAHFCTSIDLHHQGYAHSITLHRQLYMCCTNTANKRLFSPCLHCAVSLFSRALHLSYSFTFPINSFLMHFLLPRSSVPLFDVEHGVGEKEWRGGKTRTGVKRDGERRGTGVARGEQHYLINTNPGSKLFRKASDNLLSLACGMHQTDEPIR